MSDESLHGTTPVRVEQEVSSIRNGLERWLVYNGLGLLSLFATAFLNCGAWQLYYVLSGSYYSFGNLFGAGLLFGVSVLISGFVLMIYHYLPPSLKQ